MKYKFILVITSILFVSYLFVKTEFGEDHESYKAGRHMEYKDSFLIEKRSSHIHEKDTETFKKKELSSELDSSRFEFGSFLAQKGVHNLAGELIKEIKSGSINANQSLKEGDESYSPLLAALALDADLVPAQVEEFISLGAEIQHTKTWVIVISITKPSNLRVLLDYGFDANSDIFGNKVVNLALAYENYEAVDLLRERGFELEKNWTHEFPNGLGTMESEAIDLRTFVTRITDDKRRDSILKYLNDNNIKF